LCLLRSKVNEADQFFAFCFMSNSTREDNPLCLKIHKPLIHLLFFRWM
jgi:hypothetical protein